MEYVILIDDETSNTIGMSETIEFEDRKVISYNEPQEFIDFIYSSNNDFDKCKLLVVDYSMPLINGYDVFKCLFESKIKTNAKLILYSGNINQLKDIDKKYLLENNVELIEKPATEKIIDYAIECVKEI